jgi:hypothetical protein
MLLFALLIELLLAIDVEKENLRKKPLNRLVNVLKPELVLKLVFLDNVACKTGLSTSVTVLTGLVTRLLVLFSFESFLAKANTGFCSFSKSIS